MSKQTSKNSLKKDAKKGEGLSKRFIQKMAEELQSIQSGKHSSS